MAFDYSQLTEGHSLQYSPSAESSSDRASSPTHSLPHVQSLPPIVPSRYRQHSLPDITQLSVSDDAAASNPYLQRPTFRFPDSDDTLVPPDASESSIDNHASTPQTSMHQAIAHPYARLYAKGEAKKRNRKIWNHTLEKTLFDAHELWVSSVPIWHNC